MINKDPAKRISFLSLFQIKNLFKYIAIKINDIFTNESYNVTKSPKI